MCMCYEKFLVMFMLRKGFHCAVYGIVSATGSAWLKPLSICWAEQACTSRKVFFSAWMVLHFLATSTRRCFRLVLWYHNTATTIWSQEILELALFNECRPSTDLLSLRTNLSYRTQYQSIHVGHALPGRESVSGLSTLSLRICCFNSVKAIDCCGRAANHGRPTHHRNRVPSLNL